MKEAIVKQTFPSKTALSAVKKSNTDRLRNGYMTGKAKAQYLTLRFDGFNRSLFAALKAHAATTGSTPTAGMKRSASADAEGGAGPSKKARKAAQQAD
ncbi:uncharacterized protein PHACADRAFT_249039 [Phanerochaete carnosa HHB-10118-sp]|uniref:Uncharacterized protein n=1 Tax=Phanerochaete carnosa (strain HHB-10118-sp) TaxID=650164 RepID=K5WHU8_PHACS|nr:uncharacterized protein PHACADRAFT_249039 [Phanerochaete carnosa HHB-10118-sp]EKM58920.1 hypothetical protein PHACADRAFT_249039 [Phanerochaete carnosa HHB-10118-sp]